MTDVTVELQKPIVAPEGQVTRIVLREPRARDYFAIGELRELQQVAGGGVRVIERAEAIHKYIEACLVAPSNPLLLSQITLADAMRLKQEIFGFFDNASGARSDNLPSSSSQIFAGAAPPSAAT